MEQQQSFREKKSCRMKNKGSKIRLLGKILLQSARWSSNSQLGKKITSRNTITSTLLLSLVGGGVGIWGGRGCLVVVVAEFFFTKFQLWNKSADKNEWLTFQDPSPPPQSCCCCCRWRRRRPSRVAPAGTGNWFFFLGNSLKRCGIVVFFYLKVSSVGGGGRVSNRRSRLLQLQLLGTAPEKIKVFQEFDGTSVRRKVIFEKYSTVNFSQFNRYKQENPTQLANGDNIAITLEPRKTTVEFFFF